MPLQLSLSCPLAGLKERLGRIGLQEEIVIASFSIISEETTGRTFLLFDTRKPEKRGKLPWLYPLRTTGVDFGAKEGEPLLFKLEAMGETSVVRRTTWVHRELGLEPDLIVDWERLAKEFGLVSPDNE